MLRNAILTLICVTCLWVSVSADAHKYFFAISNLTLNEDTQHLEIVHQLTAHDLENAIAEANQINFSPEHANYEKLIKEYITEYFSILQNEKPIYLTWIGVDVVRGKINIYQETTEKIFLHGLVVKNDILIDTYEKQINTVNYQSIATSGSLTFDKNHEMVKIE